MFIYGTALWFWLKHLQIHRQNGERSKNSGQMGRWGSWGMVSENWTRPNLAMCQGGKNLRDGPALPHPVNKYFWKQKFKKRNRSKHCVFKYFREDWKDLLILRGCWNSSNGYCVVELRRMLCQLEDLKRQLVVSPTALQHFQVRLSLISGYLILNNLPTFYGL